MGLCREFPRNFFPPFDAKIPSQSPFRPSPFNFHSPKRQFSNCSRLTEFYADSLRLSFFPRPLPPGAATKHQPPRTFPFHPACSLSSNSSRGDVCPRRRGTFPLLSRCWAILRTVILCFFSNRSCSFFCPPSELATIDWLTRSDA